VSLKQIEQAHRRIATELHLRVAPVGSAFQRVAKARPDLPMLIADNEHASIYGTYLAANVIYAVIRNASPEGNVYRPKRLSKDEALFLQRLAWQTVQVWQK
jgi:hypothetical protein